jgi:hypothetical protein
MNFFLCQSLPAEKENATALHFHFIDISRLALHDIRPLALFSPPSDNDLLSHGKTCHKNLAVAGYCCSPVTQDLLTIRHDLFGNDDTLPSRVAEKGV